MASSNIASFSQQLASEAAYEIPVVAEQIVSSGEDSAGSDADDSSVSDNEQQSVFWDDGKKPGAAQFTSGSSSGNSSIQELIKPGPSYPITSYEFWKQVIPTQKQICKGCYHNPDLLERTSILTISALIIQLTGLCIHSLTGFCFEV
jgi:hypothetical protein